MGWSSGTELFDKAAYVALWYAPKINTDEGAQVPPIIRRGIFEDLYKAFEYSDWDTEDESKYFKSDLVHIMHDLGRIDDYDYAWYTDPDNNF